MPRTFSCFAIVLTVLLAGCGVTGSTREYANRRIEELKLELDQRLDKMEAELSPTRRTVEGLCGELTAMRKLQVEERLEAKAELDRLGIRISTLQAQIQTLEARMGIFDKTMAAVLEAQKEALDKALGELEKGK